MWKFLQVGVSMSWCHIDSSRPCHYVTMQWRNSETKVNINCSKLLAYLINFAIG